MNPGRHNTGFNFFFAGLLMVRKKEATWFQCSFLSLVGAYMINNICRAAKALCLVCRKVFHFDASVMFGWFPNAIQVSLSRLSSVIFDSVYSTVDAE
jgi:hypothetical protein